MCLAALLLTGQGAVGASGLAPDDAFAPMPVVIPPLPDLRDPPALPAHIERILIDAALKRSTEGMSCAGLDPHRLRPGYAISGFAGSEEDARTISERLTALAGSAVITTAIQVKPRPFCLLLELARDGSPSTDRPGIRLNKPDTVYRDGERLALAVTAGERGGYLSVDSYDLQNSVVHMTPLPRVKAEPLSPGQTVVFGLIPAGGASENQRTYTVSAPFGPGLIVATVSDQPLFAGDRPEVEPAEGYARAFDKAVRGLRQNASVRLSCASFSTKPH